MSAAARRSILEWYDENARPFPWRRTRDPYRILVSEVMSQQTQISRVESAYGVFLGRFPTTAVLARASAVEVIGAWRGLGYNRRAVALHAAARAVMREHGGAIPREPDALRRLPGIGEYTANAVACFAFDEQVPVVDTNVRRVLARLADGVDAAAISLDRARVLADAWLPRGDAYRWNQALMELGATLCRARLPACERCPVAARCTFRRRGARPDPPRRTAEPFTGSRRQRRGAIVDALRVAGPAGTTIARLETVAGRDDLLSLLTALERDGLASLTAAALAGSPRGRVRLPR